MGREDFERDAQLLDGLLEDGAHLVGASYGGLVALYMAAAEPDKVRSLTLMEPAAYFVAPEDVDIAEMSRRSREIIEDPDASQVILSFFDMLGLEVPLPDPIPDPLLGLAEDLRDMRGPWEADIDLQTLRSGGYPILVLTSGKRAGFEAVARSLVDRVGARHAVIEDTDHSFLSAGDRVNPILDRWWRNATK
jgi:pimeloyl-ACP methyl ester carboxylesterase